jgi:hypothetical protein
MEISLGTYIIGTFLNYQVLKKYKDNVNSPYMTIAIIYQFLLLVQLLEFLIWMDQECGTINKISTFILKIVIIIQPIIIMLILLLLSQKDININNKIIVTMLALLFTGYIIFSLKKSITIYNDCLKPINNCEHLQYSWLNDIKNFSLFYGLTIFVSSILLIKDIMIIIPHAIYISLINIIINRYFSCGIGSMLCLLAVIGPLINYIFFSINVKSN